MPDQRRAIHLLVPDATRRRVLVDARGALPAFEIALADGRTTVQAALAAVREQFGLRQPLLEIHFDYAHDDATGPVPVLTVLEPADGTAAPAGFAWQAIQAGDPATVEGLRPRLTELLAEWRTDAQPPSLRPRWARPGWYARASRWFADRLAEAGRPPAGPIDQVRHWGISALLRAATPVGAAWLKAVFPPFQHEPAVTALLAATFPGRVPTVLATEPDEGWLVLDDLGPATVDDDPASPGWLEAPRELVAIQRAMASRTAELIALGCPHRPLAALPAAVEAIVTEDPPLAGMTLDAAGARAVVARTRRAVEALAGLGLPETLIHGDFHAGNVASGGSRFVIFDWSDAAVGSPLMDVVTWLDRVRDPDRRSASWDAWVQAWSGEVPVDRLRAALPDVLAAGAAYQAVSYAGIVRNIEPLRRWENADGLEDYLREIVRH